VSECACACMFACVCVLINPCIIYKSRRLSQVHNLFCTNQTSLVTLIGGGCRPFKRTKGRATRARTQSRMHTHMHAHSHTHTYTHTRARSRAHTHQPQQVTAELHPLPHTYMHALTCAHTHTHTPIAASHCCIAPLTTHSHAHTHTHQLQQVTAYFAPLTTHSHAHTHQLQQVTAILHPLPQPLTNPHTSTKPQHTCTCT